VACGGAIAADQTRRRGDKSKLAAMALPVRGHAVDHASSKWAAVAPGLAVHAKLKGCGTHIERIVSVHDLFR
jgi:hypothetical protein